MTFLKGQIIQETYTYALLRWVIYFFKAGKIFTNTFSAFQYIISLRIATIFYCQVAGEKCKVHLQPAAQEDQGGHQALALTSTILLPETENVKERTIKNTHILARY